jgi:hypothetical protein
MKRITLILVCILCINSFVTAQVVSDFYQRGKATQELRDDGLSITHASLPVDEKVTVTNTRTGTAIEVTVIGHIQPSSERIADLSRSVWERLGLTADTDILITTPPVLHTRPAAAEPAPVPTPAPVAAVPSSSAAPASTPAQNPVTVAVSPATAPVTIVPEQTPAAASMPPLNITFNVYINNEESQSTALSERSPVQATQITPKVDSSPSAGTQYSYLPSLEIEVIPRMPNPNSGRVYRLQVGSFYSEASAAALATTVRNAGFNVEIELYGSLHRVVVNGISASSVFSAVQKFETLGIRQVWVRE